jgi:hypothetical protein
MALGRIRRVRQAARSTRSRKRHYQATACAGEAVSRAATASVCVGKRVRTGPATFPFSTLGSTPLLVVWHLLPDAPCGSWKRDTEAARRQRARRGGTEAARQRGSQPARQPTRQRGSKAARQRGSQAARQPSRTRRSEKRKASVSKKGKTKRSAEMREVLACLSPEPTRSSGPMRSALSHIYLQPARD